MKVRGEGEQGEAGEVWGGVERVVRGRRGGWVGRGRLSACQTDENSRFSEDIAVR